MLYSNSHLLCYFMFYGQSYHRKRFNSTLRALSLFGLTRGISASSSSIWNSHMRSSSRSNAADMARCWVSRISIVQDITGFSYTNFSDMGAADDKNLQCVNVYIFMIRDLPQGEISHEPASIPVRGVPRNFGFVILEPYAENLILH